MALILFFESIKNTEVVLIQILESESCVNKIFQEYQTLTDYFGLNE